MHAPDGSCRKPAGARAPVTGGTGGHRERAPRPTAGVAAALAQQHFGLVKMPGGFLISSYPCILEFGDVLLTAAGVAATGFLISLLAASGRD